MNSVAQQPDVASNNQYDVGIIGLGYVGLTLATALADSGLKVLGIERREDVVAKTNAGEPHFHEQGLDYLLKSVVGKGLLVAKSQLDPEVSCKVYVITVGTPLGPDGNARLDFMQNATSEVANNMQDGALVMLRSTVKIGTTRDIVKPILDKSGKDYLLAMCPERTLEGKALEELQRLPQIIGSDSPEAREAAARFFNRLTPTVVQVPRYETAEIIKLVDNTYRDVQFAFANEIARACEPFGVNAIDVIEGGKLGYPRTNLAIPGLVGGPCLEKDPHILNESLSKFGIELGITKAARAVNEGQPAETIQRICQIFTARAGRRPRKVAMFGVAFKGIPETNDLRGTMAASVHKALVSEVPDVEVAVFDPAALEDEVKEMFASVTVHHSAESALHGADLLLITNNNPVFAKKRIEELLSLMNDDSVIYDYWNHFARIRREDRGDRYFSVGGLEAAYELLFAGKQ